MNLFFMIPPIFAGLLLTFFALWLNKIADEKAKEEEKE